MLAEGQNEVAQPEHSLSLIVRTTEQFNPCSQPTVNNVLVWDLATVVLSGEEDLQLGAEAADRWA